MNTPPQRKRHSFNVAMEGPRPPDGHSTGTIDDLKIAALVGQLTARFVHLEGFMRFTLAALTGPDVETAGYILRTIKSPRGRIELLWDLLQKAPRNVDLGDNYDQIIREFAAINKLRNDYVHGRWWTSHSDGSVWISEQDEHGMSFLTTRPVDITELEALGARMGKLVKLILDGPLADLRKKGGV